MLTSLSKFQMHLLDAVAAAISSSSPEGVNLSACADSAGLRWMPGWIDHAAQRLSNSLFIEIIERDLQIKGDIDRELIVRITNIGIKQTRFQSENKILTNRFKDLNFYFSRRFR